MLLFVDTNIFLSFYHYSDDDLEALAKLRTYLAAQHIPFIITSQVIDEFKRNREKKIRECLSDFEKVTFSEKIPRIAEGIEGFKTLPKLMHQVALEKKSLLKAIKAKTSSNDLGADHIIRQIFEEAKVIPVTDEIIGRAARRMQLGNPPGKDNSIGDAINWETILANFPVADNLHIISKDRDFASALDETVLHGYLRDEFEAINKRHRENDVPDATVTLHSSLKSFLKAIAPQIEIFDQIEREFDSDRIANVTELRASPTYAATSRAVANLRPYRDYLTAKEVTSLIAAALENDQISGALDDDDVADFFTELGEQYYPTLDEDGRHKWYRLQEFMSRP